MSKYEKSTTKKYGMTQQEIAQVMGISRQQVNNILNTALDKMYAEAKRLERK